MVTSKGLDRQLRRLYYGTKLSSDSYSELELADHASLKGEGEVEEHKQLVYLVGTDIDVAKVDASCSEVM